MAFLLKENGGMGMSCYLPPALNVPGEIVQNGLPALTLLLDGMRRFSVEGLTYGDATGSRRKLDPQRAFTERTFNQLVRHDLRVGPGKVKTHAAVFGFHAG